MRDDLQQLPPFLLKLLKGGQLLPKYPVLHKTAPEVFVRQKNVQKQQQVRTASRSGGRRNSNKVGPFSGYNMDQSDNELRQRRPPVNGVYEDTQQQKKGEELRINQDEARKGHTKKRKQTQQSQQEQPEEESPTQYRSNNELTRSHSHTDVAEATTTAAHADGRPTATVV